jgi:hypothetical protein
VRALRPAIARPDLPLLATGAFMTAGAAFAASQAGAPVGVGLLLTLTLFFFAVVGFIAFPHITVAALIPLFAAIPAVKVVAFPWFGPLKDLCTLAGLVAAAILVVQRAEGGGRQRGDLPTAALCAVLIGLYVLDLGGGMHKDMAWAQGIRLVAEPLLLLLVGLAVPQARRTFRWAMVSLIGTAFVVAVVGILQQVVGEPRLVGLGYSYEGAIRTIDGRLRSFGTMDEPFAYAAFLLLGLAALLLWPRRGILAATVGGVLVTGIALSYVRTAAIISVALAGLWLARSHRTTIAAFVLVLAVVTAASILVWRSEGTETRTLQSQGQSSGFLTVNGRTEAWKLVLDSPRTWFVGKGVGEVGTAQERSQYSISVDQPTQDGTSVDSGYFAAIADVGIVGLVALLALIGRLFQLAKRAIDRGFKEGWLAAAFLTVLLLDAVTRASFTGFPTAFLTLLLVGVALAAAAEAGDERPRATDAVRP